MFTNGKGWSLILRDEAWDEAWFIMESDTEDFGAGSSQMSCCLFFKDKKNH
jgi:hypothetical protein